MNTDTYPTTMDELEAMATKDLRPIEKTALDDESANTISLINKYLKIYNTDKLMLVTKLSELKSIRIQLWLYYSGKADPAVYKKWGPQPLKILKGDMDSFIEAHPDYIKINTKVEFLQQRISYIENIIKALHNRGYAIKTILDFIKFTSGAF